MSSLDFRGLSLYLSQTTINPDQSYPQIFRANMRITLSMPTSLYYISPNSLYYIMLYILHTIYFTQYVSKYRCRILVLHLHVMFITLQIQCHQINYETETKKQYEGVSKSFRTGCLERELKMVQLSATRCSCITILWVSLLSFATITLCVVSQWAIPNVSIYFVIDSIQKLLDTPSYKMFLTSLT
jgi:hypothetical protein